MRCSLPVTKAVNLQESDFCHLPQHPTFPHIIAYIKKNITFTVIFSMPVGTGHVIKCYWKVKASVEYRYIFLNN